jgi:hypothetical protein
VGAALLIRFQTPYGMESGPGAEEGEEDARAAAISDGSKGEESVYGRSIRQGGGWGLGGKNGPGVHR